MNKFIDWLNDFFGDRPGLLPFVGIGLVLLDLLLQIFPGPGSGWFVDSNVLMHVGIIMSVVGILLARALEG
jgi:hypothetical protein